MLHLGNSDHLKTIIFIIYKQYGLGLQFYNENSNCIIKFERYFS